MNISSFDQCANCGACFNICHKGAISIDRDTLFYTPTVDLDRCVVCGACVKVCPVNQEFSCVTPISAYAGWHKDENIVMNSSSGGVFYGLAQYVIARGGVVFGATYSEDYKSVELASTDEIPLSKLLKSKYVESLVGESFKQVKTELEKGRMVLFCGTPCQVAGLKFFLRSDYEQLITCDFACGGLPSHKVYADYISSLEKKYHSRVVSVDFRPKTYGWRRYAVLIKFVNGKKHNRLGVEDEYLRSFLYGKYTVRDYCLECKFSDRHMSDITLADFWLYKKLSTLENSNGISLVLSNTDKGKNMLDEVRDSFVMTELDTSVVSYNNKPTVASEAYVKRHKDFLDICEANGLKEACRQKLPRSLKERIKQMAVRVTQYRKDKK